MEPPARHIREVVPMKNIKDTDLAALTWNVIYHDVNGDKISTYNVFRHGGFMGDICKALKKCPSKEEFANELRRSLFYYFCSKCEWEIIIGPWCGGRATEEIKVDVYWQVMNNWDIFLDYIWNARPQSRKAKDKADECG